MKIGINGFLVSPITNTSSDDQNSKWRIQGSRRRNEKTTIILMKMYIWEFLGPLSMNPLSDFQNA